jgi:putative SOS response-associated peptidase YedK
VPVDNFYEWKKTATGKQPFAVALADRGLMALARLWENWHSPAGEWVCSFAVITTKPNELCAELHNRMPVVLRPETWPTWLGEEPAEPSQLKAMLTPYPLGRNDMLVGEPAGRQCQNQRPQPDRADLSAISLHRCLAALSVLLVLSGCAQLATEQEQAPVPLYPHDNGLDRRGDMI